MSGAGALSLAACNVMPLPRICISAFSGGGGKTLLALGLSRAFAAQGIIVQPFKKGPDYIDAAWLSCAAGRPARNLDPFVLPHKRLRALFLHVMAQLQAHAPNEILALVEGNRGLYDGMDTMGTCSTAELARTLDCPVILSVDCTKMTRTTAALVHGVTSFEPGLRFAGAVLNRIGSSRHETSLRRVFEAYTDIPVLGALPRLVKNPLPERHMGIASSGSELSPQAQETMDTLGSLVALHLDLDTVLGAARAAPPLGKDVETVWTAPGHTSLCTASTPKPRIGYVRDAALWFYYEDNLEALERAGAQLVCLSLVGGQSARPAASENEAQHMDVDALYLGGGFPEDWTEALSASPFVRSLAAWADAGMPIYAECGGFMLLTQGIERDGKLWPMGNIFPVIAQFCQRPQGLGYVSGTVCGKNPYFPQGLSLKGHEFHYSRCLWKNSPPPFALRLHKGRGMGTLSPADGKDGSDSVDGLVYRNVWASYTHIFAPAVSCWAPNFVAAAQQFAVTRRKMAHG